MNQQLFTLNFLKKFEYIQRNKPVPSNAHQLGYTKKHKG